MTADVMAAVVVVVAKVIVDNVMVVVLVHQIAEVVINRAIRSKQKKVHLFAPFF